MNRERRHVTHKGMIEKGTLPNSFEAVLKNYEGAMECDVVLLDDGTIGVLHPRDFDMPLGELESSSIEDLEGLSIPTDTPERGGASVPLLQELAGYASDTDTRLLMELKGSSKDRAVQLARAVVDQLHQTHAAGGFNLNPGFVDSRLAFQSSSAEVLEQLQERATGHDMHVQTNLLWPTNEGWAAKTSVFDHGDLAGLSDQLSWVEKGIALAAKRGVSEIEFDQSLITPDVVQKTHEAGIKITATLVTDPERLAELEAMGVDYILTQG